MVFISLIVAGAAYLISVLLKKGGLPDKVSGQLEEAYGHLTSRDPKQFWTSGQHMTERKGGSDVASGTETVAYPVDVFDPNQFALKGIKYFTSATTSEMAITLGRIHNNVTNSVIPGSKGLSCFFIKMYKDKEKQKLNNIIVRRMKNKLGTRQLPTAELTFNGTKATLLSRPGRGQHHSNTQHCLFMVYIEIFLSSAAMRRIIVLARDYAHRRKVFKSQLSNNSLHITTLARMEVEFHGCMVLFLEMADMIGTVETHEMYLATAKEFVDMRTLLRLLTPIGKMYTAKQCMWITSEGLETFGGAGYMEDTRLGYLLRDAQVFPIWEGTTNVLAHDVHRALTKSKSLWKLFSAKVQSLVLSDKDSKKFAPLVDVVMKGFHALDSYRAKHFSKKLTPEVNKSLRDFSFTMAHVFIGALLINHARYFSKNEKLFYIAKSYITSRTRAPFILPSIVEGSGNLELEKSVALDIKDGKSSFQRFGMYRAKL